MLHCLYYKVEYHLMTHPGEESRPGHVNTSKSKNVPSGWKSYWNQSIVLVSANLTIFNYHDKILTRCTPTERNKIHQELYSTLCIYNSAPECINAHMMEIRTVLRKTPGTLYICIGIIIKSPMNTTNHNNYTCTSIIPLWVYPQRSMESLGSHLTTMARAHALKCLALSPGIGLTHKWTVLQP